MASFTGIGVAAIVIILTVAGLFGFVWVLGETATLDYINGWVMLAGFVLLFIGALVTTLVSSYRAALRTSPESSRSAGLKAVGLQILKILLLLTGIFGLIIVVGIIVGH